MLVEPSNNKKLSDFTKTEIQSVLNEVEDDKYVIKFQSQMSAGLFARSILKHHDKERK